MAKDNSLPGAESVWRRFARALGNFAEALDTTEASLLEVRVVRLEREVAQLKALSRQTVTTNAE